MIKKTKILCISGFILLGFSVSFPVLAQSTCTKKMLNHLSEASDDCLSERVERFNALLDKRYASIVSQLPVQVSSTSDDEYVGLSKPRVTELYEYWKRYQQSFCSVQASSYGLTKRYENRENSICWIAGAKEHLNHLKSL